MSDVADSPLCLRSKVVIVVGVSPGGMGGGTARLIADLGATVVGIDIDPEAVAKFEAEVREGGGSALGIAADATSTEQIRGAVAEVLSRLGRIDGLVNVVGGTRPEGWERLENLADEVLVASLNFDLMTMVRSSREVAGAMIDAGNGGSIVSFASLSGLVSAPYHAAYGSAKAGVMSMTRSMAVEWGRFGIRVNAVAPGRVATGHTASMTPLPWSEAPPPPIGRDVEQREVAGVVAFLLSGLAAGVSGQVVNVDGGVSARSPIAEASHFETRVRAREAAEGSAS